jgi:very-short-patch-repair endonuclease
MDRFKARARELRKQDTSAEAKLWQALRNRNLGGWKFRRQEEVAGYIVDFISPAAKLVIEVDGATHSTDRELARDAHRTRELERCGLHVIRFTNHEIYTNLDGVLETILAELEHRVHL